MAICEVSSRLFSLVSGQCLEAASQCVALLYVVKLTDGRAVCFSIPARAAAPPWVSPCATPAGEEPSQLCGPAPAATAAPVQLLLKREVWRIASHPWEGEARGAAKNTQRGATPHVPNRVAPGELRRIPGRTGVTQPEPASGAAAFEALCLSENSIVIYVIQAACFFLIRPWKCVF